MYEVPDQSLRSSFIVDDRDKKTSGKKIKNKWEQGENGKAQWQSLTSRSNQAKHRMPNTPRLRHSIFVTCVRGVRGLKSRMLW